MFLGFYQRLKIAGLMKLEDTSNTTLAALVTRLFLFFMFEFSFHSCVQNQKVNNIFNVFFLLLLVLGKGYMYREEDKC